MTTTLFPNLRIAKALKVVAKRVPQGDRSTLFTVTMDSRKLGTILDHGYGSQNDVMIAPGDCRILVDAFRSNGYSNPSEHLVPDAPVELDAQCIVMDLINEGITLAAMKRAIKTKTVIVLKNSRPGVTEQFSVPFSPESKAMVIAHYPADSISIFVNEDVESYQKLLKA